MKQYEKYKQTGIKWISEIPIHWDIQKMRFIGNFTSSGIDKKIIEGEPLVKIVNYTDVYGNEKKILNGEMVYMEVSCPKERIKEHLVRKGDLIFTPSSETIEDIGLSALVDTELDNTAYSYHVLRFRFEKDVDHNFKKYLCNNYFVLNQFSSNAKGTTRQILNREIFNSAFVVIPPKEEQAAIANFLDEKTTETAKLISNKQKLIELLKEERTAIINKAVNGEKKNWEKNKLKYVVSKVGSGVTPTGGASVYLQEGIPLLRSQNIFSDRLELTDVAYISEEIDEQMINSRIQDDDVLLNITGASIGRCFYVPKNFGRGNVNQHVCILRPVQSKIKTEYLHSFLISSYGQTLIDVCQNGANREGLNFQQIKSFEIPLPKISEQEEILKHIQTETQYVDNTISTIEKEIELMQEYRIALISEAVTGKIKVV